MSPATLEATARWARTLGDGGELHITFHGGEPLLPGVRFYRQALPLLRDGLARAASSSPSRATCGS